MTSWPYFLGAPRLVDGEALPGPRCCRRSLMAYLRSYKVTVQNSVISLLRAWRPVCRR